MRDVRFAAAAEMASTRKRIDRRMDKQDAATRRETTKEKKGVEGKGELVVN